MRNKPFISYEEAIEEELQDRIFYMADLEERMYKGIKNVKKYRRKRKNVREIRYIAKGFNKKLPF